MSEPANAGQALGIMNEEEAVLRSLPLLGGVHNKLDPRWIDDTETPEAFNVDLEDPSRPRKRNGFIRPTVPFHAVIGAKRIALLAELDVGPTSRMIFAGTQTGGVFLTTAIDTTNTPIEALVTSDVTGTVSRSLNLNAERPVYFQGNGLGWTVPGSGNVHALRIDGTFIDCGDANESPPGNAKDGVYFLERAWFLKDDRLYWSKLLPSAGDLIPTPSAFDRANSGSGTAGGFLTLSPKQSSSAVAVRPWRQESLICFFKDGIEEVVVAPSNPLNSSRRQIENRIGCGSRASVVQIGDEMYFLDQYFHFRALRINQLGSLQGIVPRPISEKVDAEIPGRINLVYGYRSWCFYLDHRIYVFYPRDSETQPRHCMVYDTSRQAWVGGPWEFSVPLANGVVTDIRGRGFEVYASDSSDPVQVGNVYRLLDGFSDFGTAITYRLTSKAFTGGVPEAHKTPTFADVEFSGSKGATAKLALRTSENDAYTLVGQKAVETVGTSSYPLVFPLTFPLVDSTAKTINTMKRQVSETFTGALPLTPSDLPLTTEDLPIIGSGGGPGRGRMIQWRLENADDDAEFSLVGLRVEARLENVRKDEES